MIALRRHGWYTMKNNIAECEAKTMEIILRKWRMEDAPDVARYADNENVARNLRDVFPHPYSLRDAETYLADCIAAGDEGRLCRALEADGRAVGSIGVFVGADVYSKSAELGYWLAEEYWGRGMMTQAVREICAEAFRRFGLARIYAEPFARNIGSRRVLEKAGFVLEGVMRRGVYKRGEVLDYCMYALVPDDAPGGGSGL